MVRGPFHRWGAMVNAPVIGGLPEPRLLRHHHAKVRVEAAVVVCPSLAGDARAMKEKAVYLKGALVGSASTWHDVAKVLSGIFGRAVSAREAQNFGSEGPEAFYIEETVQLRTT